MLELRRIGNEVRIMQYPANKLGTTRTGKTISIYLIDDLRILTNLVLGYDKADHFDAYALFQYLISRDMRKVRWSTQKSTEIRRV